MVSQLNQFSYLITAPPVPALFEAPAFKELDRSALGALIIRSHPFTSYAACANAAGMLLGQITGSLIESTGRPHLLLIKRHPRLEGKEPDDSWDKNVLLRLFVVEANVKEPTEQLAVATGEVAIDEATFNAIVEAQPREAQ